MNGIGKFIDFVSQNWTIIVVIIGILIVAIKEAVVFFKKSKEEQMEIIKKQIKNIMLKLVSDAEMKYEDLIKSGAIKRSEVIGKIFEMYPWLSKIKNQNELINWIDQTIDEALVILREILSEKSKLEE